MGVGGTVHRYKCQYFTFIHLHGFTGSQIVRYYNGGFHTGEIHIFLTTQNPKHPSGNIPDIGRSRLHVFIIHGGKHLGEIITGGGYRIFRIDTFVFNNVQHGLDVVFILQHHLMHFKNSGTGFPYFFQGFFIQSRQLFLCLC